MSIQLNSYDHLKQRICDLLNDGRVPKGKWFIYPQKFGKVHGTFCRVFQLPTHLTWEFLEDNFGKCTFDMMIDFIQTWEIVSSSNSEDV